MKVNPIRPGFLAVAVRSVAMTFGVTLASFAVVSYGLAQGSAGVAPASAPTALTPLMLVPARTADPEQTKGMPAPSGEPRNFEGVWKADYTPPLVQSALGTTGGLVTVEGTVPPYSADGANVFWHRVLMEQRGTPVANSPALYRPGIPLNALSLYLGPMNIVQNERDFIIIFEGGAQWRIHLDRGHPRNLTPTYTGDSVGRWEGATLVVDSTGFNTKTWLDSIGSPHSKELRFVTRISKLPLARKLEFLTTIDDPKMYTKPFTIRSTASWMPEMRMLEVEIENTRPENNAQLVIED